MTRTLSPLAVKRVNARVFKAFGQDGSGLDVGQFAAIVSVFGNVDSYGDIMVPGAFNLSLAAWKASGNPIPVVWSHDWGNPESHIGFVLDAEEVPAAKFGPTTPAGLYVLGQNDTTEQNPRAGQVSRLLAGGRITQFSFAYEETDAGYGVFGGQEGWLINACNIIEVGPTMLGANQETTLLDAKSVIIDLARRVKSGSRHSTADMASLNAIHSALSDLGVPCETAKADDAQTKADDVTSDTHDAKNDGHGSTDENTDRSADGVGSSNLRTADVMMSLELALIDVDADEL